MSSFVVSSELAEILRRLEDPSGEKLFPETEEVGDE